MKKLIYLGHPLAKYHKYVFDVANRSFVGEFEEMYQQESVDNFNSWHQDDSRQLNRHIAFSILNQYNFDNILDSGSGKGSHTHKLKRINNHVLGINISESAVNIAPARFPDIEFQSFDINGSTLASSLDVKYKTLSPLEPQLILFSVLKVYRIYLTGRLC